MLSSAFSKMWPRFYQCWPIWAFLGSNKAITIQIFGFGSKILGTQMPGINDTDWSCGHLDTLCKSGKRSKFCRVFWKSCFQSTKKLRYLINKGPKNEIFFKVCGIFSAFTAHNLALTFSLVWLYAFKAPKSIFLTTIFLQFLKFQSVSCTTCLMVLQVNRATGGRGR